MNTDPALNPGMQVEAPSIDYLGMIWRRKWLLIFGAIVGLSLGYLWNNQQPPVYQSSGEIQIVNPNAVQNLQIEGFEQVTSPLADEIRVLRSELVLSDAAQTAQLSEETKTFRGMSIENIAARLSTSGALKIAPTNGNVMGSVVTISYACNCREDAPLVVEAIIGAYQGYLDKLHKNVGDETLSYIHEAKDEVLAKLTTLESEYDAFKSENNLINSDGTHRSVHRSNAEQLLSEKQALTVQRTQLYGRYEAVRQAIERKEDPKAILILLQGALDEAVTDIAQADDAAEKLATANRPSKIAQTNKRSVQMRQQQLFPLKLKEKELLSSFATSHPAVVSLRIQIDGMEQLIAELEESERNLELAMEAERRELEAQAARNAAGTGNRDEAAELEQQIKVRLMRLDQELKSQDQQLTVITNAYETQRDLAKADERDEVAAAKYERDIARYTELFTKIVARLDELDIVEDAEARRVSQLNAPKPGAQIAPSLSRNLAMGCFLGLLAAAGIAYLFEWSDKSYHGPEEIAEHLKLPVIGHIPAVRPDTEKVKEKNSLLDPSLVTYFQPRSTFCEAYRALRTALYFSNQKGEHRVIQVTSAVPSDGKSTITANLAISTAQAGKNVLLIDCDFRRPRVHHIFNLEGEKGVAWMVENMPEDGDPETGSELIGEALQETEIPNLSIMPCGERPTNPAELLSSSKFEKMLQVLREKFDLVLIDSPPLLAVTDPSNVAARVDGVILVIRIRKVIRPMAIRAARMLETLGANVLGVVVNGVGSREAYGYGSRYYRSRYSYGGDYYSRSGYGYSYGNSYGVGDDYEYGGYYEDPADEVSKVEDQSQQLLENR